MIAVSLLDNRQKVELACCDDEEQADLELAYPILVGRPHPVGHPQHPGMGDFFIVQAGGGHYPDTPSPASAAAAAEFLQRRAGFDPDNAQVHSNQQPISGGGFSKHFLSYSFT
mmetsp:Transcript_36460/g.95991  ORF Transcript_36460/g.95991 Transcript_36460/m.95991 type:complete len:113 (+) Transcript_36460:6889-7227(+)